MDEPRITIVTITHPLGLHLRIGKDVVQVVSAFDVHITAQNLTRQSPIVNARSILQLMKLQARQGHELQLAALGPDAEQAIDAVRDLLAPAQSPHLA